MNRSTARAALVAAAILGGGLSCAPGEGGVGTVLVVASVDVTPGISNVIIGTTQQMTAAPKTASGIAVNGRAVNWSSTDPATASVSSTGMVTGAALGGPVRIRAVVDGVNGDALVTIKPVPVDRVTVTPPSAGLLVGGSAQFTASAFDAAGAPLSGRSFLWESTEPLIAAVTTTGLVIGLSQGGPVTITATTEGKSGSGTASVTTRPATRLAFAQQPGPSTAGAPLNPPIRIALQDNFLETVLGATNPVTIAIAGNPAGGVLGGTTTVNGVNGIATFGNLTLDRVGSAYTFQVTSPGLVTATSTPFDVSAGSANRLVVTQQPSPGAQSGGVLGVQPVVRLQDGSGNNVPTQGLEVTASITSGVGTLSGTVTATTNAQGVATFTNLTISGTVGNFRLTFAVPNVSSATSDPIALAAGPKAALVIISQPASGAQSGIPLAQQPVVQLRDAAGNNAAEGGVQVTVSLATGTGTLGGSTTALTNAAGTATFAIAVNGVAGVYTLRFVSPGLSPTTSGPITLGAGAPTQLAITTQPSATAINNIPLVQQPVVQLRDASNNPVLLQGVGITAAISGAALTGVTTVSTNASGVSTFSGLAISGLTGTYTITVTASGIAPATSASILLSAGTSTQLTYSQQPSISAQSGVAFTQQPVLQLRDAASNPVSQVTAVTATITGAPAGVAFVGTTIVSTNPSGQVTFSGLGLSGTAGNYSLTFTAGALTSPASNTIALSAGGASQLTYNTQPSTTVASGAVLAQQPVLLLRDGANNPVGSTLVTATITGAPAGVTFVGTPTATTNGSGVATFVGLGLSGPVGSYTLTFTAPGPVSSSTSNSIALSAGTATQLSYNTQPSTTATSGAALAQQPVLLLRDVSNNPVGSTLVTATITGAPAGVTFVGTPTATTNGSGVATFVGLGLSGPVGSYTLTFTAGAVTSAASNSVVLSAGTPTQLTYNTQPSTAATSGAAFATQPVLLLRDASNNPVGSTLVTATITGSPAGVSFVGTATATTNGSGLATFSGLGLSGPSGTYTLRFTAGALTSANSNNITLAAGGGTQLTYNTQPSTTVASGAVFAQQPALLLRDASNNPVGSTLVTATITGAPAGVSFVGTATAATNGSGVATFVGLGLSGPLGSYTLTFTSGAATSVASNTIALSAGAASQLTYSQQPSISAQSGVAFTQQPVLQLRDAASNPVSQVTAVTATITGAPAGVSFVGTIIVSTNASGQVTFSGLGLSGPAGSYTLTFTAGALTSPASNAIALSAGGASQLTYNQQPSTTGTGGQAFAQQPILLLRDASNNPIGSTLITATITGSPAGVTFVGTATTTTSGSGVATFVGLGLSGPVGSYTLTFTAPGPVSSSASNSIALSAGTATQLTYNTQPSTTANSGQAFATQPVLLLRDASNNPVGSTLVTATITGSPAGVSFVGTATATTNGSGLATFSGLGLSGPAGTYTLRFTAGALTSANSNNIALTAGTATQLTYNQQPSTAATSGAAFATQPVLLLRDASNNPVGSTVVTATITGSPAGVAFVGTATATTNGSGLATFSGLGLSGPAGTYTLTFTAGAVTSANSNNIALSAGTATQLTYNTQPSTTVASGAVFAQQPALLLRDSGNNPVTSTVVTATITGAPAGVAFVGTPTATTNGSGVATFGGLGLSGPVGSYSLTFTSGAATSAASNSISVTAGTATQLSYNTQPSTTATSGAAFAQQPVLLLRDASNNPVGSTLVTATITGAPAGVSFVGTATATTNGSGLATFSGLGLSGTAGNYTLTFTAGAPTSPASNTIALSAGGATQLTYNTQPSTTVASGAVFAQQPALLLRDAGNNPVGSTLVTATITGAPAGVAFVGTPTATTNGSGVATFGGLGLSGPLGSYTLTFTSGAATSAPSTAISVTAGTATQLTYNAQPSTTATSGAAFAQQPVLLLRDASNNPVGSTLVTATITGSPAGVSFVGTATATTNGSGVATFVGLGLSGPAGTYTLRFTAGAVTSANSNNIALSAGGATQLTYNTQPSTTVASGAVLAQQPVLLLRDASNNPVGSTLVTATITGSPAGASLVGTATTTTNGSGLATFSGLGLSGPAGNYTLTFTAGAVTSVASNTIAVSIGAPTQLTYNTQPSTTVASGAVFAQQPALSLRDSGNNPVTSTVVTATITGSPAGGTFVGTATATTNGSGVATFVGLGLSGPVGSYTLTFTSGAATSAPSNAIGVTTGAATQLTYNTQPSSTVGSGAVFAQQPVLLLRDGANNPVGSTLVTATITGSPAGVSFVGTATATTDGSGLATFIGLGLSGPSGTYTLTFTAGAVTSAASNNIVLSAGAGTQLTYNTQPSTTVASGAVFAQQPVLRLRDGANNPVGSTLVTATITGSPAGVTFVGTPTATTNGGGNATFSGLGLSGPVGSYTLTFTSGAATSAASNFISVTTGVATQLSYNAQPSTTATSGAAFAQQPVLLLRDSGNNPVGSALITATITGSPAGVSFVGTPTATTIGTGLATFSGLGLSGPAGTYTLTFTASAGAVSSVASNAITLGAGSATQISYSVQPSTTVASGDVFAQQPAILLRDAGNNPVGSTLVTATITGAPGGASLVGSATATTTGTGVATFVGLGLTGLVGNYSLTFTANAGALVSAASNTISVTAGAATQLAITTQPVGGVTGSPLATQPVVVIRDAQGNTVTTDNTTQVTVTIFSGAGGTLGGTQTVTVVNGVATFVNVTLSGIPVVENYVLRFTSVPALTLINSINVVVTL